MNDKDNLLEILRNNGDLNDVKPKSNTQLTGLQLAEWFRELKDLREENKVLMQECDRLIKEKGELLKKSEQIAEYKRLLKAAMGDMEILYETGKDEGCLGIEFKWRYADEAKKLLNDEK